MAEGVGCLDLPVPFLDGTSLRPIRYGSERQGGSRRGRDMLAAAGIGLQLAPYCGDCNVALGQVHHPGCDLEECPRCHGQAIGCGCRDDEEEA